MTVTGAGARVDRPAHQRVRGHRRHHPADAVGQRLERRQLHPSRRCRPGACRRPATGPTCPRSSARAMWQWYRKSPTEPWQPPAPHSCATSNVSDGPQRLRVGALGGDRHERRVLLDAGREVGRLGARVAAPADRPAVHVGHVRDLRAAVDDALLDRVLAVAAQDGRRRVAERIRAVGDQFVRLPAQSLPGASAGSRTARCGSRARACRVGTPW